MLFFRWCYFFVLFSLFSLCYALIINVYFVQVFSKDTETSLKQNYPALTVKHAASDGGSCIYIPFFFFYFAVSVGCSFAISKFLYQYGDDFLYILLLGVTMF